MEIQLLGKKYTTYYASKNYVVRLSEAIKEELHKAKSNVKISILCPGPVDTNFNNVAGVKFGVKPMTSKKVAKYAIDKMFKNKLLIIPGFTMKLTRFFVRFIPNKLLLRMTYNIQKNHHDGYYLQVQVLPPDKSPPNSNAHSSKYSWFFKSSKIPISTLASAPCAL